VNVNHGLQIEPPANERQARELSVIEPERRAEVWQRAVETAPAVCPIVHILRILRPHKKRRNGAPLAAGAIAATIPPMRAIAISAGKGGVGKTALAFNLAHLLSASMPVLAVDCDPQATLTWAFGVDTDDRPTLADVLNAQNARRMIRDAIVECGPALHVLPASIALAGAEITLAGRMARETILRRALDTIAGDYSLCLMDSTPSLGLLAINALAAADGVLLPIVADGVSVHALGSFLDTLDEVRTIPGAGPVELIGVVVNQFNEQLTHHVAGVDAIESAGLKVIAEIGRTVKISEGMASHIPLSAYDRHNPRNDELAELAKVVKRWQINRKQK
jgi:chromosome partitioning protein